MSATYRDLGRSLGTSVRRSGALVAAAALVALALPGCGVEREDDAPQPLADVPASDAPASSVEDDPAAAYAAWVDAWCDLDTTMTREEIIDLMGEPSGEYTVSDGGEPQLWWAQDQYDFRAYLDVDGSVLELIGDYDALSAEDRALLPCPELRG